MHKRGELFAGSGQSIGRVSFTLEIFLQKSRLQNKFRAGYSKPSNHVIGP